MKHLTCWEEKPESWGSLAMPHIAYVKSEGKVYCFGKDFEVNLIYLTLGYSLNDAELLGLGETRWQYVSDETITVDNEKKQVSKFNMFIKVDDDDEWSDLGSDGQTFYLSSRNFTKLEYLSDIEVYVSMEDQIIPLKEYTLAYDFYGFETEPSNQILIEHHDASTLNASEHGYVDLGLTSGTLWATMNVGATGETEYGKYFQWGDESGYTQDTTDGKNFYWDSYKHCEYDEENDNAYFTKYFNKMGKMQGWSGDTDNLKTLDLSDDAARANMGGDWHMPTVAQIVELIAETDSEWVEGDVNGRRFTSKTNGNSIFIPAAGGRWDGSFSSEGSSAGLWSSSLDGEGPGGAWCLGFDSGGVHLGDGGRCGGLSVRGVL